MESSCCLFPFVCDVMEEVGPYLLNSCIQITYIFLDPRDIDLFNDTTIGEIQN